METYIRRLHRRKTALSQRQIEIFAKSIKAPEDDMSLAGFTIRKKAEEIEVASEPSEKLALAASLLDFLVDSFDRQKYQGKRVHYTRWAIGKKSLMGVPISICPVCGRKGEVAHFSRPTGDAGQTTHTAIPFFMGEQPIDVCKWENPPKQ